MSESFTDVLVPGSKPQTGSGLSFMARSVIVDNYTPNPVIVNNDAAQTIPPFTFGVQRNFTGTQTAQARLDVATAAQVPPIPSVGQIVRITWVSDQLPATSGVSLQPVTVQVAGAVNIGSSGQVTILGTPTVQFASGQTVGITGSVTVTVTSGTVNIGNTPTVILGAGTASIGSVSAINSTVTVAGTINIGNTPSVTISGTPTVNIGNSPTVSVSGTVNVAITSGSVGITGVANINITSQSIQVGIQSAWTSIGSYTTVGAGAESFTTSAVPSGTLTLGITFEAAKGVTGLKVVGGTTGALYEVSSSQPTTAGLVTVPVNGTRDSTYTISWTNSTGAGQKIDFDATALTFGYPTLGQSPMGESLPVAIASDQTAIPITSPLSETSKATIIGYSATLASNAETTLVSGVAGQIIYVFELVLGYDAASGPVSLNNGSNVGWFVSTTVAPQPLRPKGANLGLSNPAKLHNFNAGNAAIRGSFAYSQG